MNPSPMLPEIALWTDALHLPACGAILQRLAGRVQVIAAGGPRGAQVETLAQSLGLTAHDDLRRMANDHPAAFLLYASLPAVTSAALAALDDHGCRVLALEPIVSDLPLWGQWRPREERGHPKPVPTLVPAFTAAPGWHHAADPWDALGPVSAMVFTSHGRTGQGSLAVRLLDIWGTVLAGMDLPDSIDAALWGPATNEAGDLRAVSGHMQGLARWSQGRSLLWQASDQAAVHERRWQLFGEQAQLEATDHSYCLRDSAGKVMDEHPADAAGPDDWLELAVAQIHRAVQVETPPPMRDAAARWAKALACAQACLLSCRTGQGESPRQMLRMHLPGWEE